MTSYRRAQRAVRCRLLTAGERLGRLRRRCWNVATKLGARLSRACDQYRQCRNENRSLQPLSTHLSFLLFLVCVSANSQAAAFPAVADLVAAVTIHQLLHGAIDRKAAWLLSRWEVPEGGQELAHYRLRRDQHKQMLYEPFVVVTRLMLCALEWIRAQVE